MYSLESRITKTGWSRKDGLSEREKENGEKNEKEMP